MEDMSEDTFPPQVGDVWKVTSKSGRWCSWKVEKVPDNGYCKCVCVDQGTFGWEVGTRESWTIQDHSNSKYNDDVWTLIDRENL